MILNNPIYINQTDADVRYTKAGNYYVKVARTGDQTISQDTDTINQLALGLRWKYLN
jgi:hypothetical protein